MISCYKECLTEISNLTFVQGRIHLPACLSTLSSNIECMMGHFGHLCQAVSMWHGAVLERTTMPKVHTQVSIHCENAENKGENIQKAITSSAPLFQRRAKVAGLVVQLRMMDLRPCLRLMTWKISLHPFCSTKNYRSDVFVPCWGVARWAKIVPHTNCMSSCIGKLP